MCPCQQGVRQLEIHLKGEQTFPRNLPLRYMKFKLLFFLSLFQSLALTASTLRITFKAFDFIVETAPKTKTWCYSE